VVLDEALDSVADGQNAILLNEVGGLALEEGLGGGGLVADHRIDHGDLLAVSGLDETGLYGDNLHVDVVATAGSLDILDFDELGHSQHSFLTHTC
jgi:hypothetical protein